MDNNVANDEKKTQAGNGEVQNGSGAEGKRRRRGWYLLLAALLLIVALIIAHCVLNKNIKDDARQSLAGAVASVNAHTPAVGVTMSLDSVTYDAEANRVTYYSNILRISAAHQQLERNHYRNMSEQDLKVLLRQDFEQDYLAPLVQQCGTTVRYVYGDTNGAEIRMIEMTSNELATKPSEEDVKRVSMKMLAYNAESTRVSCPQQVDEYTAITGCEFDSATVTLTFEITLSRAIKEMDRAAFDKRVKEQKESIVHLLSHDQTYTSTGVTVVYKYFDKDGVEVVQEVITPKDFREHHHEHEHDHEHHHD